jgi:hypothetical protein
MAYGCRFPLHRWEWEHHFLVGPPASSLGVDVIGMYSWGLAALAWLYRALCDGCSRMGQNVNLRGGVYLLPVWMWERFTVARPFHHDPQVFTYLIVFIMYTLC